MSVGYLLGIDVGTTRTGAAVSRTGARPGEVETVDLGDRSSAVPSVLHIGDDGSLLVGEAAERRVLTDPDHVVREFKRRIGDPTPVLVGGRPWAPEELSARLVAWVVERVRQREGRTATRIAVTHPASWGPHKLDLMGSALHRHGLPVTFLPEPQAAVLHYAAGERVEPGSTIAVYDFGGGTFDAAVAHKTAQGFELLGRPEGIDRLGGIDLDELVFEHVVAGLPAAFEGLDETDPAVLSAVAALRRDCAEAKEALSSDTEVSIPVLTPAAQGSVRLHRSEFEALIRPAVEQTVSALARAVASAGVTSEQLAAVLLVGGSSRIPLVAQLVSERFDRPVAVDADPRNGIAKGAALSLAPAPTMTGPQVPAPRGSAVAWATDPGAATGLAGPSPGTTGFDDVPSTQRLATTGGHHSRSSTPPPARPVVPMLDGGDGDDGGDREASWDYAPPPANRRPALLVTMGGALAGVVAVLVVFLLPRAPLSTPAGLAGPPVGTNVTTPDVPTTVPVTTTVAVPTTVVIVPPPVVHTRTPVVETTTHPPVTTTAAPPPPTTVPPTTVPATTTPAATKTDTAPPSTAATATSTTPTKNP